MLHRIDQIVDARIADAVFLSRRQWKHSLKAENVPRVRQSAAIDSPANQVFDLGRQLGRRRQKLPFAQKSLRSRQADPNLADKAQGNGRNLAGFLTAGFRKAHFRVKHGHMPVLELRRSVAAEILIQMLAGAAQRLFQPGRLLLQPLGMFRARTTC